MDKLEEIEDKIMMNTPIGGTYVDLQSPLTFGEVEYLIKEVNKTNRFKNEFRNFFKGY